MTGAALLETGVPRAGPGCFILVAGPSGAGKDTLIGFAKQACADHPRIVFPQRIVTRAASRAEENGTMAPDEFAVARAAGAFVVHWEAHGLCYGLPRSILDEIGRGRTVVANVSRQIVAEVRDHFGRTCVVLVTAPPAILAARLATRARASDGPLDARLARNVDFDEPDIVIANTGRPEVHARELLSIILDQTLA